MFSRERNRLSLTGIAAAMLLAIVSSACGWTDSTTAEPIDHTQSDDHEHLTALALADRPEGQPQLEILEPLDGAVVTSPVQMTVKTSGLTLAAPGSPEDGVGHWHVLVDQSCLRAGAFIADNATSIHVGSGSDAADIDLPVGTYELCVQVGDGFHVAINVYDTITLTVID